MPTYEYACRDCGHRFDAVQSIHDDALTECPECGGAVRRVVAAVGVQFKGSGFYRTDSRESGSKAAKKSAGGAGGDSGASGESKAGSGGSGKTGESSTGKDSSSGGAGKSGGSTSGDAPKAKSKPASSS